MADQKTVADVADKALDQITQFAHQLTELATAQAPAAWEMAQQVARVSAIANLVDGFSCAAALYILWRFAKYLWIKADDVEEAKVGIAICGTIAGSFCTFGMTWNLCDTWNWVGAFAPQLYIAHTLLNL
jgi:hypothetical protein